MDWIKRNLIFVIGAVAALGLMGLAGWYSFSGYSTNATQKEELNKQYEELKRLKALKPAPGDDDGKGKVNNIKLAREQQQEAQVFMGKLMQRLEPIPSLPEGTNLLAKDYSAALQRTIDELQREATNRSVILPPKYKFSFEAQAARVTFATNSLEPLALQLGEVRALATVLIEAKVNSLDAIRRERVSPDDNSGPATDYLDRRAVTNELAILAPYEVTFRSFTPELATVLAGFANSPHGFIVVGINVETVAGGVVGGDPNGPSPGLPVPVYGQAVMTPGRPEGEALRSRYGGRGRGAPPPPPGPAPVVPQYLVPAAPVRTGLQPFLTEKQLKVTLLIQVVRLLPQT